MATDQERLLDLCHTVLKNTHDLLAAIEAATDGLKKDGGDWNAFLAEHPELTKPDPIAFTDKTLLKALRQAEAKSIAEWPGHPGVYSFQVVKELSDAERIFTGDCIRVGRALGRLERAGKVHRYKSYGPPRWVLGPNDA